MYFDVPGDGSTTAGNHTVINGFVGNGLKLTMNLRNTDISLTRPSSENSVSVLRTRNGSNYVDINIDNCNISSTSTVEKKINTITVWSTTIKSNISITNSTISVEDARVVYAPSTSIAGQVDLALGHSTFYYNGAVCYNQSAVISNLGTTVNAPTFTGYTSIGGYDTFPDLIITEVHLNSIITGSGAGPFNKTINGWNDFDWWNKDPHETNQSKVTNADFLRYIEVYNASNSNIDLMKYKLCIDVDASADGSAVNVIDIAANAKVGAITNNPTAVIKPGETAILYLYNSRDKQLSCTVRSFKGYYGWRYNGQDETLDDHPGIAPNARDPYLVVDLTNTTVIALDDTASSSKLGNFEKNSIYYGLARDEVEVTENRENWTSWTLFEHYDAVAAANQGDQQTFNFLYGLDASADIREGRRLNETRATHNCNPGLLQDIQKLNFPNSGYTDTSPKITITEINNYTYDKDVDNPGFYDYIEVANISAVPINIYDYCILGRYNIFEDSADFSTHWFNRVNYIIPGNIGDIQSYTNKVYAGTDSKVDMSSYTGINRKIAYTNPVYSDGVLQPGQTAVLWMYDIECYANSEGKNVEKQLAEFKAYFDGVGDTKKVFAMSGARNQPGEHSTSIGLSNSNCEIYGIAELSKFTPRASDASSTTAAGVKCNSYQEILKKTITYENTTATRSGYSILDCDCVVFMYSSMLNGSDHTKAALGVKVAYQYAAAYVNGAALRFAGFLSTIRRDSDPSVITDTWNASPTILTPEQSALVNSFKNYSYTVTYKANGGVGDDKIQFAYDGTPIRLPFEIFSKAGQALKGWSLTADGKEMWEPGAMVNITENTVYYAIWGTAEDPSYKILIPESLTIGETKAGTMVIKAATISCFSEKDTLDVSISTDDGKFELVHTTNSNTVPPLAYKLISEQLDKVLSNNTVAATFTRDSATEAVLRAELIGEPIYAGEYSDLLTFKITFTDK